MNRTKFFAPPSLTPEQQAAHDELDTAQDHCGFAVCRATDGQRWQLITRELDVYVHVDPPHSTQEEAAVAGRAWLLERTEFEPSSAELARRRRWRARKFGLSQKMSAGQAKRNDPSHVFAYEPTFRPIAPSELTYTAAQVVALFKQQSGFELHATNAGNAAKALGLDYVEEEIEVPGRTYTVMGKRYGDGDLGLIFEWLEALVKERARWGKPSAPIGQ